MGNINAVPVVSQVKSGVLAATGDVERARQIQHEFVHECPGVAQVTSLVHLSRGETDKFLETNKKLGPAIAAIIDSIPVAGHIKGAIHYTLGQTEESRHAMLAATRSTGVIGGGFLGAMVGGLPGAIAGGIARGTAVDGAVTLGESHVTGTYTPSGFFDSVATVKKDPTVENHFNAYAGVVLDGIFGGMAGTGAGDYGKPTATRTSWRAWMRKNARAKITGAAAPPLPAPAPAWSISRIFSPRNPAVVGQGCTDRSHEEQKQKEQQGYFSYFWSSKDNSKM